MPRRPAVTRYPAYAVLLIAVLLWDYRRLQHAPAPALPAPRFLRTPPLPPLPNLVGPSGNGIWQLPPGEADADGEAASITRFPNTTIRTYTVTGATRRELARAMLANQPEDMKARGQFYAYTSWHVDWNWPMDPQGGCDLRKTDLSFSATVTLPVLAPGVAMDPDVLDAWHRFRTHLIEHEAGHVRHAYAHIADIAAAIRSSTCDTANQAALNAIRILGAFDAAYDAKTRHGATQGAVFP